MSSSYQRLQFLPLFLFIAGMAMQAKQATNAQQGPEPPAEQGPPTQNEREHPFPMRPRHGPMDRALHVGPPGKWWSDPVIAQKLGLTADQQKRMDDVFQQSRLSLIDLSAAVQKQEAILEPLLAAEQPEEAKVLLQIDRIAQARAELEKASARMLLGIRSILTQDQWKRLQAEGSRPPRPPDR